MGVVHRGRSGWAKADMHNAICASAVRACRSTCFSGLQMGDWMWIALPGGRCVRVSVA